MKWNAELYNEKHSFVYEFGSQIVDLLAPQPDETILDVGCGSGELTKAIADRGAKAYGIDSSPEMITKAQGNYPEIDFRVMDAMEINFDFKFDAIFSNAAFHWIRNPEKAVESISRNLKKGGRFVLEFGGKGNVESITNAVRNALAKRNLQPDNIWYFPTIGEFSTLLERYDFEVVFAQLFPRDTKLADSESGITDWLQMFGESFFRRFDEQEKSETLREVTEALRPTNYKDGQWFADYKRIRIIAIQEV